MSVPSGWTAAIALAPVPEAPWQGTVFRIHAQRYQATDHSGSLRTTGRYHRGPDQFPDGPTWPALYLALSDAIAIAELARQVPTVGVHALKDRRLTRLSVELLAVLDIRDAALLGLHPNALLHDTDWSVPQSLADAARGRGAEGLIVPSATGLGANLIVFPDLLRTASRIAALDFTDLRLYREPKA